MLKDIKEIPHGTRVVCLRRTGDRTVKADSLIGDKDSVFYYTHFVELTDSNKIETAPHDTYVVLLRQNTADSVKAIVSMANMLNVCGHPIGWRGKRPPTHWCPLPPWGTDRAALTRKRLIGIQ